MIRFIPFENDDSSGIAAFDGDIRIGECTFRLDG